MVCISHYEIQIWTILTHTKKGYNLWYIITDSSLIVDVRDVRRKIMIIHDNNPLPADNFNR